jgi:hypothetical protein
MLSKRRMHFSVNGLQKLVNKLLYESVGNTISKTTLERMNSAWQEFEKATDISDLNMSLSDERDFEMSAYELIGEALNTDFIDFLRERPKGTVSDLLLKHGGMRFLPYIFRSYGFIDGFTKPSAFNGLDRMQEIHALMEDYLPRWERVIKEQIPIVKGLITKWDPPDGDAQSRSLMSQGKQNFRNSMIVLTDKILPILIDDDAGYTITVAMLNGQSPLRRPSASLKLRIEQFKRAFAPSMNKRRPSFDIIQHHILQKAAARWKESWPDPSEVEAEIKAILEDFPKLIEEIKSSLAEEHAVNVVKHAQAPEGSPLGRIAFSPQRRRYRTSLPYEPNTNKEDELRNDLTDFIADNEPPSSEMSDMVKDFIEQGLYDDVFVRSRNLVLYRGMILASKAIQEITGMSEEELNQISGKHKTIERIFNLNPRRGSWSSWSSNPIIATNFAKRKHQGFEEPVYCVVLHANADDSLFLDMSKVYDSTGLSTQEFRKEKEHVGIGRIRVHAMEFVRC